eukprot:GEMP01045507.1.p1 GENE.GEMP01045507.1~~GEMP01045507.1.p1  ORF type:complete len:279 (+),score=57.96 GEMP01045507.1:135-971(+)
MHVFLVRVCLSQAKKIKCNCAETSMIRRQVGVRGRYALQSGMQTRDDCSAFNAHKIRPKRDLVPSGSMVWRHRAAGISCEPRTFASPTGDDAVLVLDVLSAYTLGIRTEAQMWIEQRRVNVAQNRWISARDVDELRVDYLPLRYRSLLVHKPADVYCNWAANMSLRSLPPLRPLGLALFPFGFHQPSGLAVLTNQPEVVDAIRDAPVELLIDANDTSVDVIERFDGVLRDTSEGHAVVTFPNPKAAQNWMRRYKGSLVCRAQGPLPDDLSVGEIREIT